MALVSQLSFLVLIAASLIAAAPTTSSRNEKLLEILRNSTTHATDSILNASNSCIKKTTIYCNVITIHHVAKKLNESMVSYESNGQSFVRYDY